MFRDEFVVKKRFLNKCGGFIFFPAKMTRWLVMKRTQKIVYGHGQVNMKRNRRVHTKAQVGLK